MKIAFLVNNIATESPHYTTAMLAYAAIRLGHQAWYINVGDFAYDPDENIHAFASRAPGVNFKNSEDYIKELIEKSSKNSKLEIIEEIYSDGKSRYVQLGCKKHKHSIIPKMSVTIFNNKVNDSDRIIACFVAS